MSSWGSDCRAAISLGKALAGLNAQDKRRRLGIYMSTGRIESDSAEVHAASRRL